MTTAQVEETLRSILAAEVLGHSRLQFAWVVEQAVALRSAGRLAAWQRLLDTYPDLLAERLIEMNTQVWQLPHAMMGRWTYCRRGQPMALTERLTWDVYNLLRVVFALNHRWEPDFKWLRHVTRDLAVAPERLAGRIEDIFTLPVLEDRVAAALALIQDTLALAPPTPGVARARATIQHCLERAPAGGR